MDTDEDPLPGAIAGAVAEELAAAEGDITAASEALARRAIPDVMELLRLSRAGSRYEHTWYPPLPELLRKRSKKESDAVWEARPSDSVVGGAGVVVGGDPERGIRARGAAGAPCVLFEVVGEVVGGSVAGGVAGASAGSDAGQGCDLVWARACSNQSSSRVSDSWSVR
ncbi:hypothetical protein ACIBSV_42890 [Embleya sp. NPDC050154]|uniref:hypothetical protein n=1 Tax=Embleya sp. NPDC050154 TaxID=3363988 RepID=UPI00378A0504